MRGIDRTYKILPKTNKSLQILYNVIRDVNTEKQADYFSTNYGITEDKDTGEEYWVFRLTAKKIGTILLLEESTKTEEEEFIKSIYKYLIASGFEYLIEAKDYINRLITIEEGTKNQEKKKGE